MITEKLARGQIEAFLLSIQPSLRKQKVAQASIITVESGEIMECIEKSVKSLKELFDSEARKMILEFAKDVGFGFEALFRSLLTFLQSPETGYDVERAESIYAGIKSSFQEKYSAFFSTEYDKLDDVFLSMKENLEEIKNESKKLPELFSKPVALAALELPEKKQSKPEDPKPQTSDPTSEKKANSYFFSSIKNVFNKFKPANDGFIKTDLGKDSSGMKWDPIKKKWCFDDNEEEEVEEVKKLPPKKIDIEKKKEEEQKKEEPPAEKSITDSLIKPRGKTAAERAKARKAGGEKVAPKVAKLSANVFAEINSQAATFTFEQQRELIIFELKELVSSSLNQMRPTASQPEGPEEWGLLEADLQTYRSRLVEFIENSLQRAYSHTYAALQDSRKQLGAKPVLFSQGCQTDSASDEEKKELVAQVEALSEKLANLERFHGQEALVLSQEAVSFKQLASHLTDVAVRERQNALLFEQLANEDQEVLSEEELQKLKLLFSVLGESFQTLQKTASKAAYFRRCIDVLIQANEKKGEFILDLQKKFREKQVKIYEMSKQKEVILKEKEVLKGVSRAFLQESLHYQKECDRLHLACLKYQHAHSALQKAHDSTVDFCNRLLAAFKQRAQADCLTYDQIFSELLSVCTLEKQKNTAANLRVENIIKHKVEVLKRDVVKLQAGMDSWQNQYEVVNQERIDLVKQLVDSDSMYNETLNHAQAAISRELEVQKKLEKSEELRKKLEEEFGRTKAAKSELKQAVEKLEERLRQADHEIQTLKNSCSDTDRLREELETAGQKVGELSQEIQSLNATLATEKNRASEATERLQGVSRELEETAARAESEGLKLGEAQLEAERLSSELQTAQDSLAEQTATVKLFEQLWTEAWGYLQSHSCYPAEVQTSNLQEAIELLCESISANASSLEAQLGLKLQECEELKLQQAETREDSGQLATLAAAAEKKLADAQREFERQLDLASSKHAEELVSLQKMVDDFESKQNEAEKLIADKSEEIDKLQAAHAALQESARRTAVEISELIQARESLDLTLKQKENSILDLQDSNGQLAKNLKEQIAATSTGDEATTQTISSLQGQLEAKDATLEELRQRLREEEHRALSLQGELAQKQRALESSQEGEAAYKEEASELGRKLELASQALRQAEDSRRRKGAAAPEPEPGQSDLQQKVEEHEKRISLLQMDLLEAKKTIEDYKQEVGDLRSRLFSELEASASGGSKEASELLATFFKEAK